ncbi:MAG: NUDIX domain-containing protein [Vicinamibacterales bacterium]
MTDADLTHAGGVVVRQRDTLELLIVRAKPEPHDWVLPKGHIEPGESAGQCARREVQEEAGVDAETGVLLGVDRYLRGTERVVVAFFLMRYLGEAPALEGRETRWVTLDEASNFVQFDFLRHVIDEARQHLTRHET